ncbi:MAG: hypothetical protein KGJ86_02285 [Chloroflexota bacterium]|nr:hypothetical protein [Chloroflexota bacterium]
MAERRIRLDVPLALGSLLFVAAVTRLGRLDLIDFKADEALVAGLARDVLLGKWPAASIQTSLGPFNPPLFVYLVALPMLISSNPVVLTGFVALLNAGAVLGTYLLGLRFFSRTVGLSAALFFAADPYATLYSRKLWGNFAEPIVAVVLLGCLLAAMGHNVKAEGCGLEGTSRHWALGTRHFLAWAASMLCLALLVQLHPASALLLVVIVVLAIAYGRGAAVPGLAIGALAGLAMFAPYLAFEAAHQPDFWRTLAAAATAGGHWDLESFRLVWALVSAEGYSDVTGAAAGAYRSMAPPYGWLMPLIGAAVAAGLILSLARWRNRRRVTLALFVAIPLLLTVRHSVGLEPHYYTFLLPALFLLAGIAVDELVGRWPRAHLPVSLLMAALLVGQLLSFRFFIDFLQTEDVGSAYGVPLAYQQQAFEQAARLASGDRILVATTTRDQVETARYLLYGQPNVEVDAERGLVLPDADRAVYITLADGTPAAGALRLTQPPRRIVALPGRANGYAIYTLEPTAFERLQQALHMQPVGRGLANGARLLSASAPAALPAQLASAWQIERRADPTTMIFNQLVDGQGKQWFDLDAVPLAAGEWQAGDRLIDFAQAVLPSDAPRQAYWWSTGMYVDSGRRVPFANGDLQMRLARMAGGTNAAPATPATPLDAVFGGAIRLDGYELRDGRLTLLWRDLQPMRVDYTVFVHAIAPSGALLAQHDSQPDDGRFPTSLWQPGDTLSDPIPLAIPTGASLQVGLYDLRTGLRLQLAGGADHVTIRPG